jgi:hypothetical protein
MLEGPLMLVVRIELWPHGDVTRRKTLATGFIANTGTGTPARGNYRVVLKDALGRPWRRGTVEGFPRKRLLAWDLLFRALGNLVGERNSTLTFHRVADLASGDEPSAMCKGTQYDDQDTRTDP